MLLEVWASLPICFEYIAITVRVFKERLSLSHDPHVDHINKIIVRWFDTWKGRAFGALKLCNDNFLCDKCSPAYVNKIQDNEWIKDAPSPNTSPNHISFQLSLNRFDTYLRWRIDVFGCLCFLMYFGPVGCVKRNLKSCFCNARCCLR